MTGRESLFPFVRRRTLMRRFTDLGQSYRHRIEEAERERDKAKAQLQQWVDELAPRLSMQNTMDGIRILIEVDRRLLTASRSQHEVLEHVRNSIMRRLLNLDRDYRGDLRQTEAQRMFRV